MWLCTVVGCRDFKDYRTPYKSFVRVEFKTANKNDELPTITITNTTTGQECPREKDTYKLPLNSNASATQFQVILGSATTAPEKLTIDYQRETVLISHQCGCAYKYILEKVTPTFAREYKILNKELSTFNDSDIDVQIYL